MLETLELTVMQEDTLNRIISKFWGNVSNIKWYVHTGLTDDLINCCYESDEKCNDESHDEKSFENAHLYSIKGVNVFNNFLYNKKDFKKLKFLKNNLTYQKKFKNMIHFNGIPVVKFDEGKNNSFLWQEIPLNPANSVMLYGLSKKYDNNNLYQRYNRVDLSKSAHNQFGFILKVVITGNDNIQNNLLIIKKY